MAKVNTNITSKSFHKYNSSHPIDEKQLEKSLKHIENHWPKLVRQRKKDKGSLIGLPNKYIAPASGGDHFNFDEQYYWDSYFTALGLMNGEEPLIEGMLDNMIYLYERFGLIPNASRTYFTGRSQPPILTTYVFYVYERYNKNDKWLKKKIGVAKDEYEKVWMGNQHPHWRRVYEGLSRYYDVNVLHDLAEAESGWDMTSRFGRKCLDFLPIDLNSLLYKYETDFARAAILLGDSDESKKWTKTAENRKEKINELMWDKATGFFFDYNFEIKRRASVWSLAGMYPMWAGLADEEQAHRLVKNLKKFEHRGGLTATAHTIIGANLFGSLHAQWTYPNGWAPLHYIVVEGLERYGYHDYARDIALTWLRTNIDWYEAQGEFIEKYNVVSPGKRPVEGVYPNQKGFGWTNGVFVDFARRYASQ